MLNQLCLYRPTPCLTFAPLAWLKLQYFCHAGNTEIGGFGIAAASNLLYVEDFVTVRQQVSPVTVHFDDAAVADFFDRSVDRGLSPDRFARVWCHTHPGASVTPSGTDEDTFARCFGVCDWALMFILGRTGQTYARLAFTVGPGATVELRTAVDWSSWPTCLTKQRELLGTQGEVWQQEYAAHILRRPEPVIPLGEQARTERGPAGRWWERDLWCPELDEFIYEPLEENKHDASDTQRAS